MYKFAYDSQKGCLVGVAVGPTLTSEDWEASLRTMERLAEEGKHQPNGVASILVAHNAPAPDATWRKKIAELRDKAFPQDRYVVTINASIFVQRMVTLMRWISRPPPNYHGAVLSTFSEGVFWIEERRPGSKKILERLFAEVSAGLVLPSALIYGTTKKLGP